MNSLCINYCHIVFVCFACMTFVLILVIVFCVCFVHTHCYYAIDVHGCMAMECYEAMFVSIK